MAIIKCKIDVTKIDKSRLYKGAKGTYLDFDVITKDEPDQYGNVGMITQQISKEDREAGKKGAILGNATKIIGEIGSPKAKQDQPEPIEANSATDDLPF
jgi:hypothetical protein